jgi:hypothetical protein
MFALHHWRENFYYIIGLHMRFGVVVLLLVVLAAAAAASVTGCAGRGGLFRQYEYEEEMYLSLDGTATLFVNTSIPALNALRGTTFDARPNARVDRGAIRNYFSTPVTQVTRVTSSRRNNRVFVHVRIAVTDVRALGEARPFAWSTYKLTADGEPRVFEQTVAQPSRLPASPYAWDGDELVAFRLHLPSEIVYQNTDEGVRRGNILEWEQPLSDRLRGVPLTLEAHMKGQSILYRTLLLFGASMVAVAAMFGGLIWWIVRSGPNTKDTKDTKDRKGNGRNATDRNTTDRTTKAGPQAIGSVNPR